MGLPTFLTQLYLQIIGGTAPSGAASASGDVSQMVKYIAAGSVGAYAAVPQTPLRRKLPEAQYLADGTIALASPASGWPAANDAIFVPFEVSAVITVTQIHVLISTSSGNIDVGIYDSAGNRQVSMGSTAMSAIGVQTFNIADTVLAKGRYFLGIAIDNTTAKVASYTQPTVGSSQFVTAAGFKKQATAFPLPATATFASPTSAIVPFAVLELQ